MIEKIEGVDEVVVPYKGFTPGWNVIVYNNNKNSLQDVIAGMMNSGHITEIEATAIASVISQKGYMAIPFIEKEKESKELENSLRDIGIQVELLYEKGNIKEITKNSNL